MSQKNWYLKLNKPSWAPPAKLFGPVWAVLYIIIAFSFGAVFYQAFISGLSYLLVLPFILNLIFNFSFTPLQFKLQNNLLAVIDIVLVLGTIIWSFYAILTLAPELAWVVYINIPYLLWVSFATVLQLRITYLNSGL